MSSVPLSARVLAAVIVSSLSAWTQSAFGPSNPFYAPSTLPFHAPPFDKIKDTDYQPAIEAGIAAQLKEFGAIANNPAPADFANTFVALEKSGQLLNRAERAFNAVTGADTDPVLQKVQATETPKLTALDDAKFLNAKLFARIKTIYDKRDVLRLDPESRRLVELTYLNFVRAGANLDDAGKTSLKQINGQLSVLSDAFNQKLLAATKAAAYTTTDKAALAGLTDAEIAAAAQAAKARGVPGYVLPLQNTTQQPALASLTNRATRQALFEDSGHGRNAEAITTPATPLRKSQSCAPRKQSCSASPNYAAWKLGDQMAKTPDAVESFLNSLAAAATAKANGETNDIQNLIDAQKGGFTLAPYDWDFYAEQVRKAKYDLDEAAVRPYLELNTVLQDGMFYAATQLYGITFKERKDIPVYMPDVRVFEVIGGRWKTTRPLLLRLL